MAFFGITLETIKTSKKHPDADRLDVCTLEGMDFQFVTLREQFKPGDKVLYFPLDSVLPEAVLETLNLKGKLAGSQQNRVKTVVLRGEISQGIVAEPSKFFDSDTQKMNPEVLTELLGVTKYEPEPNPIQDGILMPLPPGASLYDIEGADRFIEAAALLMERECHISEKMEGSNFSITLSTEGTVFVSMRNNTIIPTEGAEHYYWQVTRNMQLLEKISQIKSLIDNNPSLERYHHQNVTLYGEMLGPKVQGNYYEIKNWEIQFFDIRTDRGFVSVPNFLEITKALSLPTTPELGVNIYLKDWLHGRSIKEASNGKSLLNPSKLREGIVIKPMMEERWSRGRLILKQHSPTYLAKSKI